MRNEADSVAIFEWITGKRPTIEPSLQEGLFEYVRGYQRLAGPALRRARQAANFSPAILNELQLATEAILAGQEAKLQIAREALDLASTLGVRLLFVKGMMSAAVAGDPSLYRWSHDLDALCDKPDYFAQIMLEHGYYQNGPQDKHEIVLKRQGGGMLEVHRYLPVRQTPPAGHRESSIHIPVTDELDYEQLADGARGGTLPNTEHIPFPSAEVAALVCLATSMKDIIWQPYSNESARLCLFTDAFALMSMPSFDWSRFDAFVAKHGLHDVVRIADQMFLRHFPANPLQKSELERASTGDLWVQLINGPSGLWCREDLDSVYFSSFEERVRRLGTTHLPDGVVKAHRCKEETAFAAVHEASTGGSFPSRRLRALHGSSAISLCIEVDKPAEDGDTVFVETGKAYCHWYHGGGDWGSLKRTVEQRPHGYALTVELPSTVENQPVLVGFECQSGSQKVATALPVTV